MTGAKAPIDVAVGIVMRRDGTVLLGQRVPGKPYAGWWEFPGGKVEPGESVEQALARELHEELGLSVGRSLPWVVRDFVYPHATVRLHFRRVVDFDGEPRSREGQAFVWRSPRSVDVAPLLPASVPVLGWLRMPALCIRSCCSALGEEAACAAIGRALRLGGTIRQGGTMRLVDAWIGMPMVLLDEPRLAADRFEQFFYRVRTLCAQRGAALIVADSHPASFAQAADGVLVSASRLDGLGARPHARIASARCSSVEDLARAARLGFDLAIVAGAASTDLAACARLPVYREAASGGSAIRDCVEAAWREGAHGVALASSFWHDPADG